MKFISLTISLCLFCLGIIATPPQCRIFRYDENDGLSQWHVTQITQDRQGMMWFATWNGLCRYDGYEFCGFKGHVGDGSSLTVDRFRNVWLNPDGSIGCKADERAYVFNPKSCRFDDAPKGMKPTRLNARNVKADRPYRHRADDGTVWTVYHDGRVTYTALNGKETEYVDETAGRLASARLCFADRQGNLWVAPTSGLYKICFMHRYGNVDNMRNGAEAKMFFTDRHGRYWIATKEDNTVSIYNKDNSLVGYLAADGRISKSYVRFSSPVYCITQMRDGTVWMGSKPDGLFRLKELDGGMAYAIERIKGLDCNNVYDLKEDAWGRLWVATLGGGICCVANPKAERPNILLPFSSMRGYPRHLGLKVRMIHITKGNVIVAAATDGLVVAKLLPGKQTASMRFYFHTREAKRNDALSCSATMNVAEDWRGRLFVSTESGGINMIVSKDLTSPKLSFRHFGKDCGLPTDVALSVMAYGKGLLIVSSNSIILFNPDNGSICRYGKRDFLYDCRFSEALPMKRNDGKWMFGLQDGIYSVDLRRMGKSRFVPKIALTDISVQGNPKDMTVNAADSVVLSKDERSMTLSFAALDFSPDADLQYAFKLIKNGDEDSEKWNELGNNHSVSLLDLTPGVYRLLIKSTNADGVWTDNTRELTIIVTPKFSETTTARILFLLLVAAAIGGGIYLIIYIRRIRRQRHEALEAYLNLLNHGDKAKNEEGDKPLRPELNREDDALMRRVSAFVEEHIADADVNVGDIADAMAMSRSNLQRKMKQIMGVSPADFLKEARMKHSCHLLSATDMQVSEIAYACGFTDPKYFSRCFKTSTGKSPKEWRAQHEHGI